MVMTTTVPEEVRLSVDPAGEGRCRRVGALRAEVRTLQKSMRCNGLGPEGEVERTQRKDRLLKQVGFTLLMIVLYRLGAAIPVPGVDVELLRGTASSLDKNGYLQVLDLFSGGALSSASILAVGITPFITASLAFQLLNSVVPSLRELKKQGPAGQRKVASLTRIVALVMAIGQAVVVVKVLGNSTIAGGLFEVDLFPHDGIGTTLLAVSSLTVGFLSLLWLAELIGKKGAGSGMSILLLASVLSTVVGQAQGIMAGVGMGGALLLGAVVVLALALVVTLSQVERRIEVATSKQAGARRGRASSYVPLRLLQASVAPAIFAGAVLGGAGALTALLPEGSVRTALQSVLQSSGVGGALLLGVLVLFFTYFYTAVQFNTLEIAEDLAKRGMFIVGVRPGEETMHRLAWVLSRMAVAAGIVLAAIATLPLLVQAYTGVSNVPLLGMTLLIATSVATETARQIRAKRSLYDYDTIIEGNADESLAPAGRTA